MAFDLSPMNLQAKTATITGAASGFDRELALLFWKSTPQDWDRVINTASVAGLVCPPDLGVYAPSKHAVVAMTECLHHELAQTGKPVGVSLLCPAYVDTGIADSGRHRPAALAGFAHRLEDFLAGGAPNNPLKGVS